MDITTFAQGDSDFIRKEDLPHPIVATICEFGTHQWPSEDRPSLVVYFQEGNVKPLACNKTNARTLAAIFNTSDTEQMIGQKVELWNDLSVNFNGNIGGVRVRQHVPAQPSPDNGQPQPSPQQPQNQAVGSRQGHQQVMNNMRDGSIPF